jgi:S1-C subfamily serine protease
MSIEPFRIALSRTVFFLIGSLIRVPVGTAQAQQSTSLPLTTPMNIQQSVIDRTRHGVAQVQTSRSSGSGFFVSLQGTVFLITNTHVVESALEATGPRRHIQVDSITVRTSFQYVSRGQKRRFSEHCRK